MRFALIFAIFVAFAFTATKAQDPIAVIGQAAQEIVKDIVGIIQDARSLIPGAGGVSRGNIRGPSRPPQRPTQPVQTPNRPQPNPNPNPTPGKTQPVVKPQITPKPVIDRPNNNVKKPTPVINKPNPSNNKPNPVPAPKPTPTPVRPNPTPAPAPVKAGSAPHMFQVDPRWANEFLGNSRTTIGSAGCAMSSVSAMIAAKGVKIDGQDANPHTLNQYLKTHGGYSGDLIVWGAIKPLGFNYQGQITNRDQMVKLFRGGSHLILNVQGGGHWVLATGVTDKGFMVMNPGRRDPNDRNFYSFGEVVRAAVYSP